MAAVLACGNGGLPPDGTAEPSSRPAAQSVLERWDAVLSHRSAAALWGLLPSRQGRVEVSVAGIEGKDRRQGVHVHRSRTLVPDMTTSHRGIPVTTPARTIADLRTAAVTRGCPAAVPSWELRRAVRQADVLGLHLGPEAGFDRTRSDLELRFLHICRRHRLPEPEVNVRVGPYLVDFLWRDRRLVVETDGYRYHRGRAAFIDDHDRDLGLRRLGYDVIRLAERQLEDDPEGIATALGTELKS